MDCAITNVDFITIILTIIVTTLLGISEFLSIRHKYSPEKPSSVSECVFRCLKRRKRYLTLEEKLRYASLRRHHRTKHRSKVDLLEVVNKV